MNKRFYIVGLVSMFIGMAGLSQETRLTKSQKAYDNYNYYKVIETGKRKEKETSGKFLSQLGDSYYFNGNYKEAAKWYGKLVDTNKDTEPENYFRYAISLKSIHEYQKADAYMDTLLQMHPDFALAKIYRDREDYYNEILNAPRRYRNLTNLESNTPYSDYGSFVKDGKIYFASAVPERSMVKIRSLWTGESFTELYSFQENQDDNAVEKLKILPVSTFNHSTPVITKDGETMYYTRNVHRKQRDFNKENSTNILKIYKAVKEGDAWVTQQELPFNNDLYSVAHPSLNEEETKLYFVSNMPGGYGETDIYSVNILQDNEYDEPVNLGSNVNTPGRESFPFISSSNVLYFSSTGHVGLGGLDIFQVAINPESETEKQVFHLGTQINSPFDDFAYYINEANGKGYFSSNRPVGKGGDDIYSFDRIIKVNCANRILLKVVDEQNKPIKNANLDFLTYKDLQVQKNLDMEAGYNAVISCEESMLFNAVAEGYESKEVYLSKSELSNNDEYLVVLKPSEKINIEGFDLNSLLQLNTIYFELDKATIRPEAISSLDEISMVLQKYPNLIIEIGSHTDARATTEYNQKLSQRRAVATRDYLIKKGISENRLRAVGYGEQRLLNDCTNSTNCTEEEHQKNRRSEFIIIKE